MARDMVRGGSGNNLDNPTRQTGRVFFISRRNYDRAIQLEHPWKFQWNMIAVGGSRSRRLILRLQEASGGVI